jgi:hypothetical protein
VASKLESQIDELYQLPLEEFTGKRNALAKELSGSAKTRVRQLVKPTLPLWAINQLYWQDRPTFNALIDASEKLRAAHRALLSGLSGRNTDLRKPEQLHKAATERAAVKTIGLLKTNGLSASGAAVDTIRRSLAALPTAEQAGRLTRPPEPAGFTLLAGVTPRPIREAAPERTPTSRQRGARPPANAGPVLVDPAKMEKARKAAERAELARSVREQKKRERAEQAKQRARAEAARKLERAKQEAEQSANRLEAAQRRLAELEK